ncbi:ABC transporter substrate-binding protein [Mucilaginibacter sp. ZT4R22]|uniref:ABC transporter substrate-binding protein n=1 Tax=Mucilaginibacter pankratovii TaxID=2772110 RepID=A0ABR7WPW7_9SPHI|nr:helical backbone metal receptor [Mucilaginibacter pankratovii]MBD1364366.1 ABC transporter substrate-binding protein [Mucilaginibacter pankratovii]
MPVFYDQLNRAVSVPAFPKRIISIVPSQTELLFYMGLDAEIAGITKFCIHPANKVSLVPKIGGTKQLNLEVIHQLRPDLIIANKEENEQSQVEELMKHYPVWISDIHDLPGALQMISGIGAITGSVEEASKIDTIIQQRFDELNKPVIITRAAYLIWRKPYMAAGKGTFIDSMLQRCGFDNVFSETRYPEISPEALIAAKPELLLLSSEPYPFADKHIAEFKALLPNTRVLLVDGEMFSWYGSRLLEAPAYFTGLIEPINNFKS